MPTGEHQPCPQSAQAKIKGHFLFFLSSDFSGMQHTYLIGTNGWRMCDRRSASGTASACYKVSQKIWRK
jgi:hypothetical protein